MARNINQNEDGERVLDFVVTVLMKNTVFHLHFRDVGGSAVV
jgi:hypothetical protein